MTRKRKKNRSEPSVFSLLFKHLKHRPPADLDKRMHTLHREVFAKTDCLTCANCCKTTGPLWLDKDVDRVAAHLRMKSVDFEKTYLRTDEDGIWVLQSLPCPFLDAQNACSIYDIRPKACKEYPHTERGKQAQILAITERNADICPAVFNIMTRLESQLGILPVGKK